MAKKSVRHLVGQFLSWFLFLPLFFIFIGRLYVMRMLDRIDQDYQTEKMFVNNASHEINNPLTAIQGECEVTLMRERSKEEYKNSLQCIWEKPTALSILCMNCFFSHILVQVN